MLPMELYSYGRSVAQVSQYRARNTGLATHDSQYKARNTGLAIQGSSTVQDADILTEGGERVQVERTSDRSRDAHGYKHRPVRVDTPVLYALGPTRTSRLQALGPGAPASFTRGSESRRCYTADLDNIVYTCIAPGWGSALVSASDTVHTTNQRAHVNASRPQSDNTIHDTTGRWRKVGDDDVEGWKGLA